MAGLTSQGRQQLLGGVMFATKRKLFSHMNILQRKTISDGSVMTQVEFYIPLFAPPPKLSWL